MHGFALAEKSAATRRAYRSDFGIFSAWCEGRGFLPLPAAPAVVAAFLADQAQVGIRPSTLSRRIAAIAHAQTWPGSPRRRRRRPCASCSAASVGPKAPSRPGRGHLTVCSKLHPKRRRVNAWGRP